MKKCKECGVVKPLSDFYKTPGYCKPCTKKRAKEWAVKNPEKRKLHHKKHRETDQAKELKKKRYHENPEPHRERGRKWARDNRAHLNDKQLSRVKNLSDRYIRRLLRKAGIYDFDNVTIEAKRAELQELRKVKTAKSTNGCCKECGIISVDAFCSPACRKRHYQRIRNGNRRAHMKNVVTESVNPLKVLERDNYTCQICGCPTPFDKRGTVEHDAPEVDHIIPISKGGSHTYDNLRCACMKCNNNKGDKMPWEFKRKDTLTSRSFA